MTLPEPERSQAETSTNSGCYNCGSSETERTHDGETACGRCGVVLGERSVLSGPMGR